MAEKPKNGLKFLESDPRILIVMATIVISAIALVSGLQPDNWFVPLIYLGVAFFYEVIPKKGDEPWKLLLIIGCMALSVILLFYGQNTGKNLEATSWTWPTFVGYLILFYSS